jgi:hypothetical protein
MMNKKVAIGVALAAAALAFILTNAVGGPRFLGDADDLGAITLAAAAFVISWNQRSYAVAGLLVIGGIIFMIPALINTGYLSRIVIPGPILGVISGLAILGLGLASGLRTAKTEKIIAR